MMRRSACPSFGVALCGIRCVGLRIKVEELFAKFGRHAGKFLSRKFVQELGVSIVIHRVYPRPGSFAHVEIVVRQIEPAVSHICRISPPGTCPA